MKALTNELKLHVDSVVHSAKKRGLSQDQLVPMLENRVALADDKGLAGSVFWHGKWWNYSQAKTMLTYLRGMTPNI